MSINKVMYTSTFVKTVASIFLLFSFQSSSCQKLANCEFETITKDLNPSKLKIWINSFIPSDIGLSFQIPTGSHTGEWAIKGPLPISGSFLTDQRSYSTDIAASYRMQSITQIDLNSLQIISQLNQCGKTIEIDTSNGLEVCTNTANSSNITTDNFSTGFNPFGKQMINFTLNASASNPCYLTAPSITWKIPITILIDTSTNKISIVFDGYIKAFPAFEMYTQIDDDDPIILFQRYPESGSTPNALLLSPDKEIYVAKDVN